MFNVRCDCRRCLEIDPPTLSLRRFISFGSCRCVKLAFLPLSLQFARGFSTSQHGWVTPETSRLGSADILTLQAHWVKKLIVFQGDILQDTLSVTVSQAKPFEKIIEQLPSLGHPWHGAGAMYQAAAFLSGGMASEQMQQLPVLWSLDRLMVPGGFVRRVKTNKNGDMIWYNDIMVIEWNRTANVMLGFVWKYGTNTGSSGRTHHFSIENRDQTFLDRHFQYSPWPSCWFPQQLEPGVLYPQQNWGCRRCAVQWTSAKACACPCDCSGRRRHTWNQAGMVVTGGHTAGFSMAFQGLNQAKPRFHVPKNEQNHCYWIYWDMMPQATCMASFAWFFCGLPACVQSCPCCLPELRKI